MLLGMRVAQRAPDRLGTLLAFGVTAGIGIQAAMNVAVVTASVPTKGIGLPFVSFGGSGCFFYLCGVGLVLSVARRALSSAQAGQLALHEATETQVHEVATRSARQRRIQAAPRRPEPLAVAPLSGR
jgi:hypothetical protein